MTVRRALAGGVGRIAVQHHAHGFAFLIGHHREVERHAADTGQRCHGGGDTAGDLVAQRAAGNGERDLHIEHAVVAEGDVADHAEVDDRAAQLGILHRSERIDDLLVRGCRHGGSFGSGSVEADRSELPLRR